METYALALIGAIIPEPGRLGQLRISHITSDNLQEDSEATARIVVRAGVSGGIPRGVGDPGNGGAALKGGRAPHSCGGAPPSYSCQDLKRVMRKVMSSRDRVRAKPSIAVPGRPSRMKSISASSVLPWMKALSCRFLPKPPNPVAP